MSLLTGLDPNDSSDETVKVPIGRQEEYVSVPRLRLLFENADSSQSTGPKEKTPLRSRTKRTPSPVILPAIKKFEKFQPREEGYPEHFTPVFFTRTRSIKAHTTGEIVKPQVRWSTPSSRNEGERTIPVNPIDLHQVPSCEELQSCVSSRTQTNQDSNIAQSSAEANSSSTPSRLGKRSPPPNIKFSPRSPRNHLTQKEHGHHADRQDLTNDVWIEGLQKVSWKRITKFDNSLCKHVQSQLQLQKAELPEVCLETMKQELDGFIKTAIDQYLTEYKHEFIEKPAEEGSLDISPRTQKAVRSILRKIHVSGPLLKPVISWLVEMKKAVVAFHQKHQKRTSWSLKLANFLSYLIHHQENFVLFMEELDKVDDRHILKLLQSTLDDKQDTLFNYLRGWVNLESHAKLRKYLAAINYDFEEASEIQLHRHPVLEPENAFIKFENIRLEDIGNRFCDLQLQSLSINNTGIDTEALNENNRESQRTFLYALLETFYIESNIAKPPQEILEEVNHVLTGNETPTKELLWLCTMSWKHFHDTIRILYPGLQTGMITEPEEGNCRLNLAIDPDGQYRIIREITYHCYEQDQTAFGLSPRPNKEKKLASINFYWTVTSCLNDEGERTWSGCIQIPKPVKIDPYTTYEMKWKVLKGLIKYTDSDDADAINALPYVDNELAPDFNVQVVEMLERSAALAKIPSPSSFQLEFIVKNLCREALDSSNLRTALKRLSPKDRDRHREEIAKNIWNNIRINGDVLEPLVIRLEAFGKELRRYLRIKVLRSEWTDLLLTHITDLLSATKHAEYGIEVTRDLNTFLHILDKEIKEQEVAKKVILTAICADCNVCQEIIGTLKFFNASYKFLVPVLDQMLKEEASFNPEAVYATSHPWIEPENKQQPISSIDVEQIVRCFMGSKDPIFKDVQINGVSIESSGLQGEVADRQRVYFSRLLKAIYQHYDASVTEKSIQKQVNFMLSYNKSRTSQEAANQMIPCLDILRLCANSCWMVADMYIRYLYDLNNPPLKSNPLKGISCYIFIYDRQDFSVKHIRRYGVYPREVFDSTTNYRVVPDQQLSEIKLAWTLSPYRALNRHTFRGSLQIANINLTEGILAEYKHLIIKALMEYNEAFQERPGWEDIPKIPDLIRPITTSKGEQLSLSSPGYKRKRTPITPRNRRATASSSQH